MPSISMLLLFVWLVTPSAFISGYGFEHVNGSTGRSLLQIKRDCSEDFENKNYTIITSKCKGPYYSKEACCGAFKTFACPFADLINDEKTNCATTMFSYITLLGNYPPGLFANTCSEGKHGLACTDDTTTQIQKNSGLLSVAIHHPSAALVAKFSTILTIYLLHFNF